MADRIAQNFAILWLLAIVTVAAVAQPTPVDQVPRLQMFDKAVDYKKVLAGGVLAPDRIDFGSTCVSVHQGERKLIGVLGQQFVVVEEEVQRNREEQWAYLRNMASKYSDSMHYYIIQEIYYHMQLSGWFKVHEWKIYDLRIRAFLVRTTIEENPRIWLLHLIPQSLPERAVSYVESESLALNRRGECEVQWNVSTNRVVVRDSKEVE